MNLELPEDGLGIKVILVLADKVLSHICQQNGFKDRIDELLLLSEKFSCSSAMRNV